MEDDRITKLLLYGQLTEGHRDQGRPFKRYRDTLKVNLKRCLIDVTVEKQLPVTDLYGDTSVHKSQKNLEAKRASAMQAKKERRKYSSVLWIPFQATSVAVRVRHA